MKTITYGDIHRVTQHLIDDAMLIDLTANEVAARLGTTTYDVDEDDGMGMVRGQGLEMDNGRQFGFRQNLQGPAPYNTYTTISCVFDQHAKNDLSEIMARLKITEQNVVWCSPKLPFSGPLVPQP